MLTNVPFDRDPAQSVERDYYQRMVGRKGRGGGTLSCEAPYGNVYLRSK